MADRRSARPRGTHGAEGAGAEAPLVGAGARTPPSASPRGEATPPRPARAGTHAKLGGGQQEAYLVDPASSICLSHSLSHASLSTHGLYSETANGSLNQLWFL